MRAHSTFDFCYKQHATTMALQTREQVDLSGFDCNLPALIVNDVVATESHFCELILGRYGLWCSSYCRPGSLTCPGARARSRPVRLTT